MCAIKSYFRLFLVSACFFAATSQLHGQGTLVSQSDITRLAVISQRLAGLNQMLSIELEDCKSNSVMLSVRLAGLQLELDTLKIQLSQLEVTLLDSQATSDALREQLVIARNSLLNSQKSLDDYKTASDKAISKANGKTVLVGIIAGVAGILIGLIGGHYVIR